MLPLKPRGIKLHSPVQRWLTARSHILQLEGDCNTKMGKAFKLTGKVRANNLTAFSQ